MSRSASLVILKKQKTKFLFMLETRTFRDYSENNENLKIHTKPARLTHTTNAESKETELSSSTEQTDV